MATTTKEQEFKQVEHKENNSVCFFDKSHSNQKNYRDSAPVWLCVPAMEKIQNKFGVTIDTTNQTRAVILMAQKCGIDLNITDLNRSKDALTPKTAKADTTKITISKALIDWIVSQRQQENKPSYDVLRTQLREAGNSNELIDAHFKAVGDKPLTQIPQVAKIPKA